MRISRTTTLLSAGALLAGALGAALPAGAAATGTVDPRPPLTTIDPASLTRGPDPTVPHTDRGWFAFGDQRVKVGKDATYLGRSGSSYVVIGYRAKKNTHQLLRIGTDGSKTLLRTGLDPYGTVLSRDGSRVFSAKIAAKSKRTVFRVFDATTGERTTRRVLPGYAQLLAATRTRAYLSDDTRGTYTVNARGRKATTLTSERAVLVDLANDLVQTFTGDPYRNGCSRLVHVSDPTDEVWKSCSERVEAIAPDGSAFATVDLLSDGIGPSLVLTRDIDGTLTGRYATTWFGTVRWESGTSLLAVANGPERAALVRCTAGRCENAADTYATPQVRQAPRPRVSPLVLR